MATEFMSSTSSSSYLVDYLSPDPNDLPPIDQSQDPFQSPMSPVQSAASTPPLSNQQSNNNNHPQMASFATPVSLSSAPYSMPIPAFPRRAEHSYAQNNYLPHPYNMGAPPPPPAAQRPRGPQLPSASLLQPQQSTYVPDVPSSAPDAPPSGSGGSRKRPKYTRSKKGCLTCRSKKIKCDERKPLCTRCEHGHRECTWPETVLPRRPKGAIRGLGNEDDEEEEDERRGSIPGSAVSSHFPSSTTSTHFPGIGNNSPFETAPRRDTFESDGYTNGSQFPLPLANARPFYPRAPGSGPSGDFYPVTTVNGQPIDEYEFPPRQTFGAGSSSGSAAAAAAPRGPYSNGSLYATGPPGSVPSYNGDMRRASWDSSAPTDGRRPSWDNNSLAVSSASSPASSALGLGLGGVARGGGGGGGGGVGVGGGAQSAGSSTGGNGGSASGAAPGGGLMLFQSPDPLSPFFRSVQERNLVGNISSFTPSSTPPFSSSPYSSASSSSFFSSSSASSASIPSFSDASSPMMDPAATSSAHYLSASSPVLSSASSTEFGVTPEGMAYRKNSYPHLYPPPRPLTLDPPAPVVAPGGRGGSLNFTSSHTDLITLATAEGGKGNKSDVVDWLAPPAPTMDVYRPSYSMEGEEYLSWDAYS